MIQRWYNKEGEEVPEPTDHDTFFKNGGQYEEAGDIPEDFWMEELKRCKESPAYFYNNYFTINGKKPTRIWDDEDINNLKEKLVWNAGRRNYGRD